MLNKDYIYKISHDSSQNKDSLRPVKASEFLNALEQAYGDKAVQEAYKSVLNPLKNPKGEYHSNVIPFAERVQNGLLNDTAVKVDDQIYLAKLVQSYVGKAGFWQMNQQLASALKDRISVQS